MARTVAFVTETFPPEINGVAKTVSRMIDSLAERGFRVNLVRPAQSSGDVGGASGAVRHTTVRSIEIPVYSGLRFGFPAFRRLMREWTSRRPDIVHVSTEGPLGLSAVIAARRLELPLVTGYHTNFQQFSRYYGLGFLERTIDAYLRAVHNRADCTVVPTMESRSRLAGRGFRELAVLGRGVDTTLFNPSRRDGRLRENWGAAAEDPVVLYVGRLAAEKNLDLAIRTFREIRARQPKTRLIVVGCGPQREKLKADCPEAVVVGALYGEELARHYASADIFLFPSLTDTFGNVVLEAMASGLAIVAFDYAAARELLSAGESAALAPFADEREFVRAACELASRAPDIETYRRRAALLAERCTWGAIGARLEAIYARVRRTHSSSRADRRSTGRLDDSFRGAPSSGNANTLRPAFPAFRRRTLVDGF